MLTIRGDGLKIKSLLALLSQAASLELSVTGEVVSLQPESSDRLRASLRDMVSDYGRTAKVDVNLTGLSFGVFGDWQKLNVADVLGIEQGAPGMGTAIAIHEIWENYSARTSEGGVGQYGPAHKAALEVERAVAKELTDRDGGRVAAAAFGKGDGTGYVLDYEDYFLVLEPRPRTEWQTGRFMAAVADRDQVSTAELAGVVAGQRAASSLIAGVVAELRAKPRATAQVTGLRLETEDPELGVQRAWAARNAIVVALDEDEYADQDGIELRAARSRGAGADLGARRAWASPAGEISEAPGVQIVIWLPET